VLKHDYNTQTKIIIQHNNECNIPVQVCHYYKGTFNGVSKGLSQGGGGKLGPLTVTQA